VRRSILGCDVMSIHRREAEVLRRRALEFLEHARIALERGSYDLACFLSEQALQLYLKSVLLMLVGDYPRTHSIRVLLSEVIKALNSRELEEFARVNRVKLIALEDAYLMARYFASEYGREDAEELVKVATEAISLVSRVIKGRA